MSLMFTSLIGTSDAPIPIVKEIPKTVFRLAKNEQAIQGDIFHIELTIQAPADSPDNIIDWGNGVTTTYGAGHTDITKFLDCRGPAPEPDCWDDCWDEWVGEDCWEEETGEECWTDCWWSEADDEEVCEEVCDPVYEEVCEDIYEEVCFEVCDEPEGDLLEYTITIYGNHTGITLSAGSETPVEFLELSPELRQFALGFMSTVKFPEGFHLPATIENWSWAFPDVTFVGEDDIETLLADWSASDTIVRNVSDMFSGSHIAGYAPGYKLWGSNNQWSDCTGCFDYTSSMSNFRQVPDPWNQWDESDTFYILILDAASIVPGWEWIDWSFKFTQVWQHYDGTWYYSTLPEKITTATEVSSWCFGSLWSGVQTGEIYRLSKEAIGLYVASDISHKDPCVVAEHLIHENKITTLPAEALPENLPGTEPYYIAVTEVSNTYEEEWETFTEGSYRKAYKDAAGAWRLDTADTNVYDLSLNEGASVGDIIKCNWAGGSMGVVGQLAEGEL